MKFFKLFTVAAILATSFIVCSCENEGGLTSIRGRLDELEQVVIPSINQQLVAISASVETLNKTNGLLNDYIKTIKEQIEDLGKGITPDMKGIQKQVDSLASAGKKFSDDLTELRKYIDDKNNETKEWVELTFATLDMYSTVQDDLSKIKTQIEKLDADALKSDILKALKDEISSSIKASEDSMKQWVGEKLEGYYTIAEINAKLAEISTGSATGSLSDEDKNLISSLREEIESAKTELTSAYKKAIDDAITKNNGVVDSKIEAAIIAANEEAGKTLDSINDKIDALEKRIKTLEGQVADLIKRVQSITVVPEYEDGSIGISASKNSVIKFEMYPIEAAQAIAALGSDAVSLKAVYTKTKASAGDFVEMSVVSCSYDNGLLLVTTNGSVLDEDFFSGAISVSARLLVNYAGASATSQYFPLYAAE